MFGSRWDRRHGAWDIRNEKFSPLLVGPIAGRSTHDVESHENWRFLFKVWLFSYRLIRYSQCVSVIIGPPDPIVGNCSYFHQRTGIFVHRSSNIGR